MRKLSYATLVLACMAPWFVPSANATDADSTTISTALSSSDAYYIDSRAGGDAGQYVDQVPGASIPSAQSMMPADDWQPMSGSSVPPAEPQSSSNTKTPDWL